jgi:hypothetical protein
MKLLKYFLVLFISITITSCSDSSSEPPYTLSNANIAGTYNIKSLSLNTEVTSSTIVAGVEVPFTVASSESTGDTFGVTFVLNTSGSYTVSGQYRIVSVVTPAVGDTVTNNEIIRFPDAGDSGTYNINTTDNTITFTSASGDFLEGTLTVIAFNETTVSLSQELEEVEDAITTKINANISFVRQ